MTITYRETGEGSALEMVQEAQRSFGRANRLMQRFVEDWEDGNLEDLDRFAAVYKDFKTLLPAALKERERLEGEKAKLDGIVGDKGYALDFDAARDEIGRRLACLAAQGRADGVSG